MVYAHRTLGKRRHYEHEYEPKHKRFSHAYASSFFPAMKKNIVMSHSKGSKPEYKFNDIGNTIATISTPVAATTPTYISGIAEGTDFTNRLGRKVTVKNLMLRYLITNNAQTAAASGAVRVVAVYDRQPNGALPVYSDVFTPAPGGQIAGTTSMMNLSNRDRFFVLHDKTHEISPQGPQVKYCKKFRKINTDLTFKGTDNTIASASSGAMYIFYIPDTTTGGAAATKGLSIELYSRLKFIDT